MTDCYISIDLETTGLHPKQDKIIEIGAVKVIRGREQATFSTFVNPGRKLEERIIQLTGIQDEMIVNAPCLEEVLPDLFAFLEDLPLLGHKILFDYSFLKKAAVDRKLSFEKEGIDTLKIARKYLPELEHKSLEYLCRHYGMEYQAHRALEDTRATHALYGRLLQEHYREEDVLFSPQKLHFQVKRDTPATKAQKERLYRLLGQHKIEEDFDMDQLSRSEADRRIDKILAEYGR